VLSSIIKEEVKRMSTDYWKSADSYFDFGKNWASYAKLICDPEIGEAKRGPRKSVPAKDLAGESFLDIGCSSGLHALATAQLDVNRVLSVGIDALTASAPVDGSGVHVYVPMLTGAGFIILWKL
jgi:2-polyprenyl-3-methyl-5-hydroxy-6-metoxy-1,4-benzoquinol methylase